MEQAVYRIIESAASSRASVFITGKSGSGKEVCADAIHNEGNRRDKPFIALNCAAIPGELMESEIFGHVKGAFTGAVGDRKGAATMADGGTLFLDEIGEMDLALQSKLLRFVQTGTFQKVGGNKIETVDVRFISATNRDPSGHLPSSTAAAIASAGEDTPTDGFVLMPKSASIDSESSSDSVRPTIFRRQHDTAA